MNDTKTCSDVPFNPLFASSLPSSTVFSASYLLGIVEHARFATHHGPFEIRCSQHPISEAPCTNRLEKNRIGAPELHGKACSFCGGQKYQLVLLIPELAGQRPPARSLQPLSAGKGNSMKNLAGFFGCRRPYMVIAFTNHRPLYEEIWQTLKRVRARNHQKSHALRMLLTSGVVRSADIDPPSMGIPAFTDTLAQPGSVEKCGADKTYSYDTLQATSGTALAMAIHLRGYS